MIAATLNFAIAAAAVTAGAAFAQTPHLPAEWKLLVVTGFLGALTTISSFSAEVVMLLQQERTGWALATIAAHVLGSLAMTFAGIASVGALRSWRKHARAGVGALAGRCEGSAGLGSVLDGHSEGEP